MPIFFGQLKSLLLASFLFDGMIAVIIGSTIEPMMRELSIGSPAVSILLFCDSLGFQAAALAGGILSDRFGRRFFLLAGFGLLAVFTFLFSRLSMFPLLAVVWLLIGAGAGFLEVTLTSLTADLCPDRRGFHLNVAMAFFGFGAMLCPLASGMVLENGGSWRLLYLGLAVCFGVMWIFLAAAPVPVSAPNEKTAFNPRLFLDPRFILMTGMMIAYVGAQLSISSWVCLFLVREQGLSSAGAATALSVFWGAMIAGRLWCGILANRWNEIHLVILISFLGVGGLWLACFIRHPLISGALFGATGLFYGGIWPTLMAYGARIFPRDTGAILGTMVASGGAGAMIFPVLLGFMAKYSSLRISLAATGLLLVFIIIGMIVVGRLQRMVTETKH